MSSSQLQSVRLRASIMSLCCHICSNITVVTTGTNCTVGSNATIGTIVLNPRARALFCIFQIIESPYSFMN